MNRLVTAATAVTLALTVGACMQQSSPQQLNTTNANSRIYIGALSCNVAGSTGYVLGSSKTMECVFLGKDGQSAEYSGTINKVGIDIGYTKAVHTVWRVYSLGSDRKPNQLSGTSMSASRAPSQPAAARPAATGSMAAPTPRAAWSPRAS